MLLFSEPNDTVKWNKDCLQNLCECVFNYELFEVVQMAYSGEAFNISSQI